MSGWVYAEIYIDAAGSRGVFAGFAGAEAVDVAMHGGSVYVGVDIQPCGDVLFIVGVVGIFLISVPHGIVMIVIAALISPFGLPMLAVKLVCMLDSVTEEIKRIVYT